MDNVGGVIAIVMADRYRHSRYNDGGCACTTEVVVGKATEMRLSQSHHGYTIEEYLALERASEERHEYLDGQIYAMAVESPEHGDICTNLVLTIGSQLRGSPCRVWTKDTKVRSGPFPKQRRVSKGLCSYPDLVVVCGEPQFHDHYQDVLLNPTVIIEVLSPHTEVFDRREKFRRDRLFNPSLSDYVIVAQDQPLIEHFVRQEHDQWLLTASVSNMSGSVYLAAIQCTLQLSEVYDRLVFTADVQEPADEA